MALITGGERAYQETGFMGSHGRSGTHGFFCRILSGSSTSDSIVAQSRLTTRMAEFHGPPSGITGHPEQQSILTNRGTRRAKEENWGASGFAVGIL